MFVCFVVSYSETARAPKHDPKNPGHDRTIVFYNDSPTFAYKKPDALVDVRSGVICSPNNFDDDEPLGEGMIRITGHENGAVYGATDKKYDGRTHLDNLYVCGTDQGMVGSIGSIVSGITIANKYLLGG